MQPIIDWELLGSGQLPFRTYCVFKITTAEGHTSIKGWLDNGIYQEGDDLSSVRNALILLGMNQ